MPLLRNTLDQKLLPRQFEYNTRAILGSNAYSVVWKTGESWVKAEVLCVKWL